MMFQLILTFEGMDYYGEVPFPREDQCDAVEIFQLDESDVELLNDHFVDPVNSLCGTLLDYGDVDFFNAEKCKALNTWLMAQIGQQESGRLKRLYTKLLEFATRATEAGTGVVVEL